MSNWVEKGYGEWVTFAATKDMDVRVFVLCVPGCNEAVLKQTALRKVKDLIAAEEAKTLSPATSKCSEATEADGARKE